MFRWLITVTRLNIIDYSFNSSSIIINNILQSVIFTNRSVSKGCYCQLIFKNFISFRIILSLLSVHSLLCCIDLLDTDI